RHRLVVLNPGAGRSNKRWPVTRFRALAERLCHEAGAQVLVLWGPSEHDAARAIVEIAPPRPALAPSTDRDAPTAVAARAAVMVARNEEERLRACLEAVGWVDEIVVVDAESEDKTVAIAQEFTDRVVVRPWPGYAAQKNTALDLATGDWVLSLDADEVVSPELRAEIARVLASDGPADGYTVPRRNIFWGRWVRHGGLYPDRQL